MAQKRNFESLEDVTEETTHAEVHFGVELLSPLKTGGKTGASYYNGKVNDGTKPFRLVGFDSNTHDQLLHFTDRKTPIKATNCAIKKSRLNPEELEIHVNRDTTFTPSPRRLNFTTTHPSSDTYSSIQQIPSLDNGTHVNVKGKVVKIAPARTVSSGDIVQEITLQGESGTIVLSMWNNNVDRLSEGDLHNFRNLTVNTFRNNKLLNFGNNSHIIKLENAMIDTSNDIDDINIHVPATTIEATLNGIQGFQIHVWCQHCDSKIQFTTDTSRCGKCQMLQLTHACRHQITGKMLFKTVNSEPQKHILNPSTHTIVQLLQIVSPDNKLSMDSDKVLLESSNDQVFIVTYKGQTITDIALN